MIDTFPRQPPEKDTGNREYKRQLYLKNNRTFPQKATQMLYRIYEGNGVALYLLGIEDNGDIGHVSKKNIVETIECLKEISKIIEAEIKSVRMYELGNNGTCVASVKVYKNL